MLATMGDAHREWHANTGIPMGTPGCPQDACHPPEEPYCFTCYDAPDATVDGLTEDHKCPDCGTEAEMFGCETCGEYKPAHPNDWHGCDVTRHDGLLMATPDSCAECRGLLDW